MHGPDVRGDCGVTVQVTPQGQPTIAINSRIAALYGESIRTLIQTTLATLAAADVSLTIDDSGALPYVIQARIEAAVRRLRPGTTSSALPPVHATAQAEPRSQLRRSRLYLPGNTPKFFINAGLHRPDAIILDLEDSVPPSEKDAALILVRNALRAVDFYSAERMVRVNALPAGLHDMRALAGHGVHTFLLPKAEDADMVRAVSDLLDQLGDTNTRLLPIIESARGVLHAYPIVSASPRVVALAIGLEDYTADIGAQRTTAGRESWWAQGQIVNAARAAKVQPLASVYSAIDDEAGLRTWLADARGLGFAGAGCLHPRQIRVVHAAFAPSLDEVAHAQRLVAALERAQASGSGAVAVDGAMVDAPVAERARQVLRLAEAAR
jgi:citrate lyase subunit beta/citryl-CoA lyase